MLDRRKALAGLGSLSVSLPAGFSLQDVLPQDPDSGGRLTVPVIINGAGPFRFVVDTAANASVIAGDIATQLALPDAGQTSMNSLVALERVQTVSVQRLQSGTLDQRDIRLIIGSRTGLDGTDGLIGGDLLGESRIIMQFRGGRRMEIGRSRNEAGAMFTEARRILKFQTPAERRFGTLMMIEANASGASTMAIIDSGAQISIINRSLAEQGHARAVAPRGGAVLEPIRSPTGRSVEAETAILPYLRFGTIRMRALPVLVGDFHIFDVWGLADRPAMLIGIDILSMVSQVVIDIKRAELVMEL